MIYLVTENLINCVNFLTFRHIGGLSDQTNEYSACYFLCQNHNYLSAYHDYRLS